MRFTTLFLIVCLSTFASDSFGQGELPPTGGGLPGQTPEVGRGPTGGGSGVVTSDALNQGSDGATGGGNATGSDGQVEPIQLDLGGDLEDTRNQGFVGATADRVQELGFVGASSETSGPPLSEGATFGGGVNNSGTQAGGGGSQLGGGFRNGFNGGFGGNQFGAAGSQNGFQIVRRNLRTKLVSRFDAPISTSAQTATRFQERIARQPAPRSVEQPNASSVSVRIENRTAILTGYTDSPAMRERWERQLRLEPGVDRIVNQIKVTH